MATDKPTVSEIEQTLADAAAQEHALLDTIDQHLANLAAKLGSGTDYVTEKEINVVRALIAHARNNPSMLFVPPAAHPATKRVTLPAAESRGRTAKAKSKEKAKAAPAKAAPAKAAPVKATGPTHAATSWSYEPPSETAAIEPRKW